MKNSSTFFPICDCRKSILLFGKEKSSDYKRSVTKSGMTVTGVHLGPSYTIPDRYRSGVTFVSDRGLSYTTPYQSDTQRSD